MSYVKWQDIIEQTNGGLEIIKHFYPDAAAGISRRDKKFKVRNEKTASASIRLVDGEYKVTDFGGDQRERNAIGICMLEMNLQFNEACDFLGKQFHIQSEGQSWNAHKPEITKRPLGSNENQKDYNVTVKDFTDAELKVLGPCVDAGHCRDYNLESLKAFTYCKENEAVITESTEFYPIMGFVQEGWTKLYQPMSFDKQFRFRFLGTKPEKFIYGLDLLKREFQKRNKAMMEDTAEDGGDTDARVERVFLVSGGSDGLNIRSFGQIALWYNSESEKMDYEDYRLFLTYAKEIIYVPDLDRTGLAAALDIGLKFLDVKIMMLPDWLRKFNDRRGNPRKDFKDFVEQMFDPRQPKKFNTSFNKLIDNAIPCEFWTGYKQKTGKTSYQIRWTQLYNFLKLQGFGRYKDEHVKDGFQFVRVENNVVKVIRPVDIEAFVHQFLKDRQLPIDLRDKVYATALSDRVLSKMDQLDIDFNIADRGVQYMFFLNEVWEITEKGIERIRKGEADRYVWERKVIEQNVFIQPPHFNINHDDDGDWDIEVLKTDNMFFNYLINASRIHWKKELEDSFKNHKKQEREDYFKLHQFDISGPRLTEEEVFEQKLHLINKIYSLGYLLHTYKSPQRPWAVYAMDNKVADISESHGGSGKSVFLKSMQQILKNNHYINGRDSKKTQDDFIYHGITDETDFILVDDCHQYMDYGFFFNAITGDLDVNNKQGMRYIITFDRSPKIGFASNYPPKNLDPSLERRLLFVVFSDYYHYNKDDEYEQTRTISDDFNGRTLFKDFNEQEWNDFYNFAAQCIRFYLAQPQKIDPPMGNVSKRNLLNEMGEAFKNWADVFFMASGADNLPLHLDRCISRTDSFEDFKRLSGRKNTTPQRFKKSLKAYCQLMKWTLNPVEAGSDSNGRIVKKVSGETVEMFYIQTQQMIQFLDDEDEQNIAAADDNKDDLPF